MTEPPIKSANFTTASGTRYYVQALYDGSRISRTYWDQVKREERTRFGNYEAALVTLETATKIRKRALGYIQIGELTPAKRTDLIRSCQDEEAELLSDYLSGVRVETQTVVVYIDREGKRPIRASSLIDPDKVQI